MDDALTTISTRSPTAPATLDRDGAAGDDRCRRCRRCASRRRALPRPRRQGSHRPVRRAARASDRRRARRDGVRDGALKVTPGHDPTDFAIGRDHRLAELTMIGPDGDERRRGRARRAHAGRGGEAHLGGGRARPDRKRESYRHAVPTCERCHTRIEPLISLQWWCRMDEIKQPAIEALRERQGRVPSRVAAPLRDLVARGRARLEHLPPDLVGTPAPRWYCPDGHVTVVETEPERVCRVRLGELRRDNRCARHMVLVGALAVRDARLARRDGRPHGVLSRQPADDRARDHSPLGEPHDLRRPRAVRRGAVHRRDHPLDAARARRPAHVEVARHRHRSGRRDREAGRRRAALRAAEDVLDAGRALQLAADRGGAEAREQALEREPAPADGGSGGAGRAACVGRGALDPRAHRRDTAGDRGRLRGASTSRTPSTACTTSSSTTSATGTSSRSSRASPRRTSARRRSRRSNGSSSSSIR